MPWWKFTKHFFLLVVSGWLLAKGVASVYAFVPHAETRTICVIQGSGFTSPYVGARVITEGVVTADFDDASDRGFFVQHAGCDGDANTSDGVFVSLSERVNVVSVGDWVQVEGEVLEYFGLTGISITPGDAAVLSSGNPAPPAFDFSPPDDETASKAFFEARESMLVQIPEAFVVGPTSASGETWVARGSASRVLRGEAVGRLVLVGGEGLFALPNAKVGDQAAGLQGVLDYSLGLYRLRLMSLPAHISAAETPLYAPPTAPLLGTLNLHNLFDTTDDPATEDPVRNASEYQRHLKKLALAIVTMGEPALVAVQEVENGAALQALVNRPELAAYYDFVWVDGPDVRGIDIALLYRADMVQVASIVPQQGCTARVDGLGPDGNRDPENPVNAVTCDTDGNGTPDGNRLFSRPPLLVQLSVCDPACGEGAAMREMWVLVNHWKSKSQDTDTHKYTLPRRLEQAQFVAALAGELMANNPNIELVVLGDFNDYVDSEPLGALAGAGLYNLMARVGPSTRYTFIYQGVSQTLDHVLVSPVLAANPAEDLFAHPIHLNADYPASYEGDDSTARRSSDHEPIVVKLVVFEAFIYLPLIQR